MRHCIVLLLSLASLASSGCLSRQDPEEREGWSKKRWQEEVRKNERRLKPEDEVVEFGMGMAGELARRAVGKILIESFAELYNYMVGRTPFVAAKDLLDPASADRRRRALVYLSERDYGRQDPYTRYYAEMARNDEDPSVRAMAIRALNRARDGSAEAIYIQALDDAHSIVRLEAAKALANIPSAASAGPLIRRLNNLDEETDVRVAAADALRNHRTSEAAQALVRALRDREFGVAWQARRSLRLMIGEDYGYDQAAWLTYLSDAQPFG